MGGHGQRLLRRAAGAVAVAMPCLLAGCTMNGVAGLAHCVEKGARELQRTGGTAAERRCRLVAPRESVVLAFPADSVPRAELEAAGLSDREIAAVRELQLGDSPYERLNVVPPDRRPRPSRTTYHRRFVETPELLACRLGEPMVTIHLRREGDRTLLAALECA